MKLTDIEKRAIEVAVYRYVDDKQKVDNGSFNNEFHSLTMNLFTSVMELVTKKDYGDEYIEDQLQKGAWTTPEEVINYLEALPI